MEVVKETNVENKKALKKRFCSVGANLLVREVFLFFAEIMMGIGYMIYSVIKNNGFDNLNSEEVFNNFMINPLVSIIPILIGFMPVLYFINKNDLKQRIMSENKKFTLKTVIILFILLLGVNCACGLVSTLMESGLNVCGFTLSESEKILETLDAPAMLIYVGIIGPVVEELIYRGMVLRFLDKFDKGVAIVGSGVLFGLMHANFCQIFMAIGIGIFLGYITEEYSIKIAIVLHMMNNLLSVALDKVTEQLGIYNISEDVVSYVIMAIFILILIVAVVRNLQKIKSEFAKYKPEKKMCVYFFTSFSVVLLMAVNLIEAFGQISRI